MSTCETEKKRIRRSPEERAADFDAKIEAVNHTIADLEAKKQAAVSSYDEKIAAARKRVKVLEEKRQRSLPPSPSGKSGKPKSRKFRIF